MKNNAAMPVTSRKIQFRINYKKLVNVILYIVEKSDGSINKYNLMKILFEADKHHMQKHIRPVTGDRYIKMKKGTVPVETLSIINGRVKEVKKCLGGAEMDKLPFQHNREKHLVVSKEKAYRGCLSKSDIKALDQGIKEYGGLKPDEVEKKNHQEKCWKDTPDGKQINYEDIITEGKTIESNEVVDYLRKYSRSIAL